MSTPTPTGGAAPESACEPTARTVPRDWTQADIDSERQRIADDRSTQREMGHNSTPAVLADIERHIRQMKGDHLAVAFEVLDPSASNDTFAIAELQKRLGHDGPARAYRFRQTAWERASTRLPTSLVPQSLVVFCAYTCPEMRPMMCARLSASSTGCLMRPVTLAHAEPRWSAKPAVPSGLPPALSF